jgi:hypothetical protein
VSGYKVVVAQVGRTSIPGPELFWMTDWDQWYPITFNVALVTSGDVVCLVNTGAPKDLAPLNARWMSIFGERGEYVRGPKETITARLRQLGVKPSEVTDVVCTPFQMYSTSGLPLFRRARIHLSKRGWIHYHTTHDHPHDDRWTSIAPDVLTYLCVDAWDRVHLLEDSDEIAPGIRTWFSGTHHRASVAVEVDSTAGTVVLSDSFFYYENVEAGRLLGINENMYEALACNERTLRVADHIVPLYDPAVFERYPGGVVAS